jgi:hypothetical protein
MPRRRLVALCTLVLVLSAIAVIPSCTDSECANGGEGCSCTLPDECGQLPTNCHAWLCDGTCQMLKAAVGSGCLLGECLAPGTCVMGYCTAEPSCVECLEDAHCNFGHTCELGNVCSRCDDGLRNGDETDVDCGGSCPLCTGTCNVDVDCPGGYCWDGLCARCDDGIQNGDETGVDCGVFDGHCSICFGIFCASNDDCASNTCENGYCCATSCPLCYKCIPPLGECVPIQFGLGDIFNASDPSTVCYGDDVCDGKGKCALGPGKACTQSEECASSTCTNGKCT